MISADLVIRTLIGFLMATVQWVEQLLMEAFLARAKPFVPPIQDGAGQFEPAFIARYAGHPLLGQRPDEIANF